MPSTSMFTRASVTAVSIFLLPSPFSIMIILKEKDRRKRKITILGTWDFEKVQKALSYQ